MKYLSIAFAVIGCVASLSYCTIQSDKARHEIVMWCLKHGGNLSMWNGQCELPKPTTDSKVEEGK